MFFILQTFTYSPEGHCFEANTHWMPNVLLLLKIVSYRLLNDSGNWVYVTGSHYSK